MSGESILNTAQSMAEKSALRVMPFKIPVVKVINYNTDTQDFLVLPSAFGANIFTNLSGIVNNGDSAIGDFIIENGGKTPEQVEAERLEAERLAQIEVDRLAQIEVERLAKIEAERLASYSSWATFHNFIIRSSDNIKKVIIPSNSGIYKFRTYFYNKGALVKPVAVCITVNGVLKTYSLSSISTTPEFKYVFDSSKGLFQIYKIDLNNPSVNVLLFSFDFVNSDIYDFSIYFVHDVSDTSFDGATFTDFV
jgi:hypothetical protein